MTPEYPRLAQLGIPIHTDPVTRVLWADVNDALARAKMSLKRFDHLFGVQTVFADGPYPDDVEAVLERMISRKKTGSQAVWD